MTMTFTGAFTGTSEIIQRHQYTVGGTTEGTSIATWLVQINEGDVPAEAALQLGRLAAFGPSPVPQRGAALTVSSAGSTFTNKNLRALDFHCYPVDGGEEDFADAWKIEVGFREPIFGMDEVPSTAHFAPGLRATEGRFEFVDFDDLTNLGRKVTNESSQTVESDFDVMVNTANHPIPMIAKRQRVLVYRLLWSDTDPQKAIKLSEHFDDTVNSASFPILGKPIKKHHARFLSCDQWQAGYYGGVPYYMVEFRIEIGRKPFYLTRPSEGPFFLQGASTVRSFADDDGRPISGPFALGGNGELADYRASTQVAQAKLVYLLHRETSYADVRNAA